MRNEALLHTDSLGLDKDPHYLTHCSKRWNMHCICGFEFPWSWRVGNTAHFYGSVLSGTLPSQALRAKEIPAKATLFQVFCYCCVSGGSLLSTHFGACKPAASPHGHGRLAPHVHGETRACKRSQAKRKRILELITT
ncbi:hypothetical protein FVEG_15540 [Fusarium verticillioides 7600]|uniref:Uncharacterized protein n=1 Tax=Gibberella moniliformis (strain M3125 / FGSC 7600) TaxID=334819 RepID=W7LVB5_GIBM7|nr:hypothetical protein FVEG_15540 [Fusarium verticillioides 7600]EWG43198.1 hypothetical protein FVEG_15540 [Fusarium verticillioides 7600]